MRARALCSCAYLKTDWCGFAFPGASRGILRLHGTHGSDQHSVDLGDVIDLARDRSEAGDFVNQLSLFWSAGQSRAAIARHGNGKTFAAQLARLASALYVFELTDSLEILQPLTIMYLARFEERKAPPPDQWSARWNYGSESGT